MSYRIEQVIYKNFCPFTKAEVNFDSPGLTTIEGQIEGKKGCDSNGAGKSFLFDGIAWALYGRCIRERYKGDDVIKLGSKGGTSVEVTLLGEVPLRVVRHRKDKMHKNNVLLFVDGKNMTRGTNPETDRAIEELLGMDYLTFSNSVAFGAREDIKSFFSAPDSERKRILENILGLGVYAEAEKIARRDLKTVTTSLMEVHDNIEDARATLREGHAALEAVKDNMQKDDVQFQLSVKELGIRSLTRAMQKKNEEIEAFKEELALEQESARMSQNVYAKKKKRYDEECEKLRDSMNDYDRQIAVAESTAESFEKRIARLKKLEGTCPTCEQAVSVKKMKQIVKDLEEQAKTASGIVGPLDLAKGEVKLRLDELVEPEEIELPELELLESEVDCSEDERRELAHRRDLEVKLRDALATKCSEIEGLEQELQAGIDTAQLVLTESEAEQGVLQVQSDRLEFWVQGFGNSGLKSFLIEAEIPEINKRATQYARRLLGDGAIVRLSATKELKSKKAEREELTVEGSIPNCTNSYAGASKGQKKRMDLSLILAFRDIVSTRAIKSFGQLFADEIFDGLDRSGTESIADLLKEVSEEIPVALITHDVRLRSYADRNLVVKHRDGNAEILLADNAKKLYTGKKKPRKRSA